MIICVGKYRKGNDYIVVVVSLGPEGPWMSTVRCPTLRGAVELVRMMKEDSK
jgi:hypothetical protein